MIQLKIWIKATAIVLICIFYTGCASVNKANKDDTFKGYFDIKTFEENQEYGNYIFYRNKTEIEQIKGTDEYFEYQRPQGKVYEVYSTFYLNGKPKEYGRRFKEIRIGIWKFYDENGNETIRDEDEKFGSFDYNKLLSFFDKKGYINAKNGKGLDNIHVFYEINEKAWRVFATKDSQRTSYYIDGNTGKILEAEEWIPIK